MTATLLLLVGGAPPPTVRLTHIGLVAPNVAHLVVTEGRVLRGRQVPFRPGAGTTVRRTGLDRWVDQDGKTLGGLVGRDERLMQQLDRFEASGRDPLILDKPSGYRMTVGGRPVRVVSVGRKTRPIDLARIGGWEFRAPLRHDLYLRLDRSVPNGARVEVSTPDGLQGAVAFRDARTPSDAVQAVQTGYRPDDPVKVAYVGVWMGTGGPLKLNAPPTYRVLEERTGRVVLSGRGVLSRAADQPEDAYNVNYNGTDVWRLDFSNLRRLGRYRVSVAGVGVSEPFRVGPDVWSDVFRVAARGFYHQRSGIALGPPYTQYRRPRNYRPEDGLKVFASTTSLMDSGNGLNALGTDKDNFGNLVKGRTPELVQNAWGGYHDAGDWDRRIQHLDATRQLLELWELFPRFRAWTGWNIPESGDNIPDLLNEAWWGLEVYRRMQTPDGGIRGGIEQTEHPRFGEMGHQDSLDSLAYAPDPWSSDLYAATAARFSRAMQPYSPRVASLYRASAVRAAAWADAERVRLKDRKLPHQVIDAQNLSSIELFRLTGEARWRERFLATTGFTDPAALMFQWQVRDQGEAAFAAARTPGIPAAVRTNARNAILRAANLAVTISGQTGYGWSKDDAFGPIGWGRLSSVSALSLPRAHHLTGDARYLRALVRSAGFGLGANPQNLSYTTGLGARRLRNPLIVDMIFSHQAPPPGITVFGPRTVNQTGGVTGLDDSWEGKLIEPFVMPTLKDWPTTDAYFDVHWMPNTTEFTIMTPMGPNAYVWGYLAARPRLN